MKEVTKLEVRYWHDEIDGHLDETIKRALAVICFECYASGYDLKERRRDLCFEKKSSYDGGSVHGRGKVG